VVVVYVPHRLLRENSWVVEEEVGCHKMKVPPAIDADAPAVVVVPANKLDRWRSEALRA
jgi:hypothetical protein